MKRIHIITLGFIAAFVLLNSNLCHAQETVGELKITIKQLEAKNKNLEEQLKKCKKNSGNKKNADLEKRVRELEEEKKELTRENIRLRGSVTPMSQDTGSHSAVLEINDPAFKDYLLRYCDMDNDGQISKWDAEHTYVIDLEKRVKSSRDNGEDLGMDLEALKYFTNLKKLVCTGNRLKTLDLTNNTGLETLIVNDCNLKFLDVSKNAKLKRLECNRNLLYVLNLDNNTELLKVDASSNELDELSVSRCKKLTTLRCSNNTLRMLDLSNNKNLCVVDCSGNKLSRLSLVNNPSVDSVLCRNNNLTELDLCNNRDIKYLDCWRNKKLEEVFVSEGHYVLSNNKDKKTKITRKVQ